MNSFHNLIRALRAAHFPARLLLLVFAGMPVLPHASAATPAEIEAAAIQTYKSAYAQVAQSGNVSQTLNSMDQAAAQSTQCTDLANLRQQQKIKRNQLQVPPNPKTVLSTGTCLSSVVSTHIPSSGIGVLDSFVNQLVQQNTSCQAGNSSFLGMANAFLSGNTNTFMTQIGNSMGANGQVIGAVNAGINGNTSGVINYAGQMVGVNNQIIPVLQGAANQMPANTTVAQPSIFSQALSKVMSVFQ